MAKSVCIIGGGPSGIIAAKTLLYDYPHGTFNVTVFEQARRIGGLWPLTPTDEGMVDPNMTTNLSQHTVSFSELAWLESTSTFPKAWQVGQYLKQYLDKYPAVDIQTSCKVTRVSRLSPTTSRGSITWMVEVEKSIIGASNADTSHTTADDLEHNEEKHGEPSLEVLCETYYFDRLIVASGFFGKPKLLKPDPENNLVPVIHSSQFRRLEDLYQGWGTSIRNRGNKILVVGGSMSGVETAASIAMQLSSARHSTKTSPIADSEKYTVYHVTGRPFWVMPSFLPVTPLLKSENGQTKFDPAPTFLPLDLVMYDLSKRPDGAITNRSGYISPEAATLIHERLESLVGTDQSDLTHGSYSHLTIDGKARESAPWIAINNSYAEFVRSGQIVVSKGRLSSWGNLGDEDGAHVMVVPVDEQKPQPVSIEANAAIILATGFDPVASLDFLPADVLGSIGYDPQNAHFPLALNVHSTAHPDMPDLGFVGFYRGPFWGVMEMQARYLGKLWTGNEKAVGELNTMSEDAQIIKRLYQKTPQQPAQFPMGDYVYLMESFKDILGVELTGDSRKGPAVPARYAIRGVNGVAKEERVKAIAKMELDIQKSADEAKFVAGSIFSALQGDWKLTRFLKSSIATYPSGTFNGSAKFFPRYPEEGYDAEYLYLEEGNFETETGLKFAANRRYAHRYHGVSDRLSVWFIKPDNKTVDYLFHELEILPREELPEERSGWRAKAHHLCIEDTYDVKYEFRFKGANIEMWTLAYSVKGPNKDYRIESVYRR